MSWRAISRFRFGCGGGRGSSWAAAIALSSARSRSTALSSSRLRRSRRTTCDEPASLTERRCESGPHTRDRSTRTHLSAELSSTRSASTTESRGGSSSRGSRSQLHLRSKRPRLRCRNRSSRKRQSGSVRRSRLFVLAALHLTATTSLPVAARKRPQCPLFKRVGTILSDPTGASGRINSRNGQFWRARMRRLSLSPIRERRNGQAESRRR